MNKNSQILFYTDNEGETHLEVIYQGESLWLSQKRLAELFGVQRPAITKHLKNIFNEGELAEDSVSSILELTADDGKQYQVQHYNLDAIIAVGYRINSYQATRFRIWATTVLREYMSKGFVLDDNRLKQGSQWGKDYFDELLEKIREIRASERRFYQKITDIYAECSSDYDAHAPTSKQFFSKVQNKLHWAITGKTAAEIIHTRANASAQNMGLHTWKNAPKGKVLKSDISVAKNYLNEDELRQLNRIVTMYLDFAELQAERQRLMTMEDWAGRLDSFLDFNDYEVLQNSGKITAKVAKNLAVEQYEKFRIEQDKNYVSDFDKVIKTIKKDGGNNGKI